MGTQNKLKRNLSDVSHENAFVAKRVRKPRCKTSKSLWKKPKLKSGVQKLYGTKSIAGHPKKKVLCLKRKCTIGRKHSKLLSMPLDMKKKLYQWLLSQDSVSSESKRDNDKLGSCVSETCSTAIPPVISGGKLEDKMETEISAADVLNIPGGKNQSSSSPGKHMTPVKKSPAAKLSVSPSVEVSKDSYPSQSEESVVTRRLISDRESGPPQALLKSVSKAPLPVAESKTSNAMQRKRAHYKFYLKNSRGGCLSAQKKFRQQTQKKKNHHNSVTSAHSKVMHKNSVAKKDIPLKVFVSRKLSTCGVAQSLNQGTITAEPTTPLQEKLVRKIKSFPKGTATQNVVTCGLPNGTEVEAALTEGSRNLPEATSNSCSSTQNLQPTTKRDVCYIFALLDREKDETLFKCSPEVKTHQVLQQLANVIGTISCDDDVVSSKKIFPRDACETDYYKRPVLIDRSTSPISFFVEPVENDSESVDSLKSSGISSAAEEVCDSLAKEVPDKDSKPSAVKTDEELTICTTTKVIISKALFGFTADVKNLTDVSIRILGWCSGTVKGDLDSDLCDDDFEGFLCHCHDKVSILIECISVLDSKQVLNIDGAELNRLWLLHDAIKCLLQAYRYMQHPSASPSLIKQLISLMIACSKMILPSARITISKWTSMMTMVSGIARKLCEDDVLSNVCWCHRHFAALRKDRSCGLCNVKNLFTDLCKLGELSATKGQSVNKTVPKVASTTGVEQLLPRFSCFLSEVEGLSKEEFTVAFAKHSVVRFSCNEQSRLFPCDEHLTDVVCSCFAPRMIAESHNLAQTEENSPSEIVISTHESDVGEGGVPTKILNQQAAQSVLQEAPQCSQNSSMECQVTEKANENSDSCVLSLESLLGAAKSVTVLHETTPSSMCSTETYMTEDTRQEQEESRAATNESDCDVITLSEGESSQDFSLVMEDFCAETEPKDLNTQKQSLPPSGCQSESVSPRDDDGDASCVKDSEDSLNSLLQSSHFHLKASSPPLGTAQSKSQNWMKMDRISASYPDSQNSVVEVLVSEEDSIKESCVSNDSIFGLDSSSLSLSNSQNSVPSSEEDLIKNDGTDDSLCKLSRPSAMDLVRGSSLCGTQGSASTDENCSQETEDGSIVNTCDFTLVSPEHSRSLDKRPVSNETDSSISVTVSSSRASSSQEDTLDLNNTVSSSTLGEEIKSSILQYQAVSQKPPSCAYSACSEGLRRRILNRMKEDCLMRLSKAREREVSRDRKKGKDDNRPKSKDEPLNVGGHKEKNPEKKSVCQVSLCEKYPIPGGHSEQKSTSCLKRGQSESGNGFHLKKRVKFALDLNSRQPENQQKNSEENAVGLKNDQKKNKSERESKTRKLKNNKSEDTSRTPREEEKMPLSMESLHLSGKSAESSRMKKIVVRTCEKTADADSKTQGPILGILNKNGLEHEQSSLSLSKKKMTLPTEDISQQIAESVKMRKRDRRQIQQEAKVEYTSPDDFSDEFIKKRATKSKRSKKLMSNEENDRTVQFLNESDPDWKIYLSDLKGRILDDQIF